MLVHHESASHNDSSSQSSQPYRATYCYLEWIVSSSQTHFWRRIANPFKMRLDCCRLRGIKRNHPPQIVMCANYRLGATWYAQTKDQLSHLFRLVTQAVEYATVVAQGLLWLRYCKLTPTQQYTRTLEYRRCGFVTWHFPPGCRLKLIV
jgi:hypothetical protein